MGGGNKKGIIGGLGGGYIGDNCEDIRLECSLFSPSPTIISKIKKGDILSIEFNSANRSLVAVYVDELAGTILSPKNSQIINCIVQKNILFEAKVKEINGGNCKLLIKAK